MRSSVCGHWAIGECNAAWRNADYYYWFCIIMHIWEFNCINGFHFDLQRATKTKRMQENLGWGQTKATTENDNSSQWCIMLRSSSPDNVICRIHISFTAAYSCLLLIVSCSCTCSTIVPFYCHRKMFKFRDTHANMFLYRWHTLLDALKGRRQGWFRNRHVRLVIPKK